jgi:hypothetical protein
MKLWKRMTAFNIYIARHPMKKGERKLELDKNTMESETNKWLRLSQYTMKTNEVASTNL